MSIPTLVQVYDETRRLAIAGSAVASGDFRLKKLVPPLEKSGEKAPVFAKVAQAVTAVVDGNERTASAALLDLTTLVNAILYTQGETGAAGELVPLESVDLGTHVTQAGARVLKPLLEALSSTGSGRIELVRDAFTRGAFKDLRLIRPALAALDDPYSEIGDFMAERVLPLYGRAIVPQLRAELDLKGKAGGQLNRLRLMHRLDPAGSRDVVRRAVDEGSKEMKVAAIECLGDSADDQAVLLDQSRSKAKDVRAAAFGAMAAAGVLGKDVLAALKGAIDSADLAVLVGRLRQSPLAEVRRYVLDRAEAQAAEVLAAKDVKAQGPAVARLQQLTSSLDPAADPAAEAFVLRCFDQMPAFAAVKSQPAGADFNELVVRVMAVGTPAMQRQLVASQRSLEPSLLPPAIYAARTTMSPADFYDEFHDSLVRAADKRTKKGAAENARSAAVLDALDQSGDRYYFRHRMGGGGGGEGKPRPPLDPRWLDAAVAAGAVETVCHLARPGHAAANWLLAHTVKSKGESHELYGVLAAMVRVGHPEAVDTLVELIQKQAKGTSHYYFTYWYGRLIAELPRSALPRFEAILPTLPDKMVDQLMDSITALRDKPE